MKARYFSSIFLGVLYYFIVFKNRVVVGRN